MNRLDVAHRGTSYVLPPSPPTETPSFDFCAEASPLDGARRLVFSNRMTSFEVQPGAADDSRVVVLVLTGELDLTNASELEERLERALPANGPGLVLDLRRVAFVDSAALHVLFRIARALGKERFGLVVEPQSAIARVFEIVRISQMARIGDSIDDLSAPPPA